MKPIRPFGPNWFWFWYFLVSSVRVGCGAPCTVHQNQKEGGGISDFTNLNQFGRVNWFGSKPEPICPDSLRGRRSGSREYEGLIGKQAGLPRAGKTYIPWSGNTAETVMTYQWRSRRNTAWKHIPPVMTSLQTWLTFLPEAVLKQLP